VTNKIRVTQREDVFVPDVIRLKSPMNPAMNLANGPEISGVFA